MAVVLITSLFSESFVFFHPFEPQSCVSPTGTTAALIQKLHKISFAGFGRDTPVLKVISIQSRTIAWWILALLDLDCPAVVIVLYQPTLP